MSQEIKVVNPAPHAETAWRRTGRHPELSDPALTEHGEQALRQLWEMNSQILERSTELKPLLADQVSEDEFWRVGPAWTHPISSSPTVTELAGEMGKERGSTTTIPGEPHRLPDAD